MKTTLARIACETHFKDCRIAWQFAFLRTMAVPRMAKILAQTGRMQHHTQKRAYDTGLMMFEVIHDPDGPRAATVLQRINALHDRPDILAEDMTWILTLLGTLPGDRISRWSPQPLTETELEECWQEWKKIGKKMGITDPPDTFPDARTYRAQYEQKHLVDDNPQGAQLMQATVNVLAARMPTVLRPIAPTILSVGVDNRRASKVLGLPVLPQPVLDSAAAASRFVRRHTNTKPAADVFTPGMSSRVYRQGYSPEDLGSPTH